jgi:hypothetical protein
LTVGSTRLSRVTKKQSNRTNNQKREKKRKGEKKRKLNKLKAEILSEMLMKMNGRKMVIPKGKRRRERHIRTYYVGKKESDQIIEECMLVINFEILIYKKLIKSYFNVNFNLYF